MSKRLTWLLVCVCALFAAGTLAACGSSDSTPPVTTDGDTENEAGENDTAVDGDSEAEAEAEVALSATTTAGALIVPGKPIDGSLCATTAQRKQAFCLNPALSAPYHMGAFTAAGFGEWTMGAGEAFALNEGVGVTRGTPSARRSLFRMAHFSDVHITDEEGTVRMASYDTRTIDSAMRPADMYTEHVLNAAINTLNMLNADAPINVALFTGDMSDTSEKWELKNFLAVAQGGEINPDSGAKDDPIAGPNNDPQDLFTAVGFDKSIPWILTIGNHDNLVIGNNPVTQAFKDESKGDQATTGTRNGASFAVVKDTVVADPERELLFPQETLDLIADHGDNPKGHGFTKGGKPYYSYDVPGTILRVIVLASSYRPEGYEGSALTFVAPVMAKEQFNDFLLPELDRAKTDKKLVIISTHGPSADFEDDGLPERFISAETFVSTLLSYPNVILHCVGHEHYNRVWAHKNEAGTGGYFEVESPSLADWPQEFRVYELVDNGNGTLSLFSAAVDYAVAPGSMEENARRLGLIDTQSGWYKVDPSFTPEQRTLEMVVAVPEGFADAVAGATAYPALAAETRWKTTSAGK